MKDNQEIWKEIPSFPNYEASNLGRIRRAKNERIVKMSKTDIRGYQQVCIFYNKKKYSKKVARLVWEAFNGYECSQTIDHIDNNKENNRLDNLQCIPLRDNLIKRTIYKKQPNKYNLTDDLRIEIVKAYRSGELTTWRIAEKYGIPSNYISTVMKRGSWDKIWKKRDTKNIS